MQTLTNSYHNTSINLRTTLTWDQIETAAYRAHSVAPYRRTSKERSAIRRMQRIKETLCGSYSCTCGTVR